MKIGVTAFAGMQPHVRPKRLGPTQAQEATNCKLWTGDLEPWSIPKDEGYDPANGDATTIFQYLGQHWFEWDKDIDVIRSPIANDTHKRAYWTGDGEPKKTDHTVATTSHPYPATEYLLEVPKPAAPTASVGDYADESRKETVAYALTFVTDYGEEGEPSDASNLIDVAWRELEIVAASSDDDWVAITREEEGEWKAGSTLSIVDSTGNDGDYTVDSVNVNTASDWVELTLQEGISDDTADGHIRTRVALSDIPTAPTGAYNIAKVRIYRYMAGTTSGEYVYADEVSIGTTSYSDSVFPVNLGEVLPTTGYDVPPSDMAGLTLMANGVAAGFSGNEICLSEPYLPHAYPNGYRQSTDYSIVGLGSFGTTLVVLTEGIPYALTGVDPASMTLEEIDLPQACVSKRGIVSLEGGVVYPAPDGLVWVGRGTPQIITRGVLTRDQWKAYDPTSIHAYYYDNRYFGFYNNGSTQGGFIFDPQDPANTWTEVDYYATAGYADLEADTLYLVIDGSIDEWDAGSSSATYRWRSKIFQADRSINFTCGRVFARSFDDLTLRIYADGQLAEERVVHSDAIFRLPAGFRAREWEIELEGTDAVEEVQIASSPKEIG